MARRKGSDKNQNTDQQVEDQTPDTGESTVEQDVAAKPATPIDLTGFKAAVEAQVDSRDESTGKLPEESHKAINEEYRKIDGLPGKNAARKHLEDSLKEAVKNGKINLAQAYVDIKDNLSAGSGGGGTKAPADPTEAFVARVAAFNLAQSYLLANVPDEVNDGWEASVDSKVEELQEQFDQLAAYHNSDDEDAEAPEVGAVARQAWKLVSVKGGGGSGKVSDGPRGNTAAHIAQVFADQPVGTFLKVQEIAKVKTTEYPGGDVSPGAISARLFPKGKEAFDQAGVKGDIVDNKKGATKYAEA